jgi:hypothetical protein
VTGQPAAHATPPVPHDGAAWQVFTESQQPPGHVVALQTAHEPFSQMPLEPLSVHPVPLPTFEGLPQVRCPVAQDQVPV